MNTSAKLGKALELWCKRPIARKYSPALLSNDALRRNHFQVEDTLRCEREINHALACVNQLAGAVRSGSKMMEQHG